MSRPSPRTPPSSFQTLISAALHDYEKQTGTGLVDHPLAKQLEQCDSVASITAILQEQARIFHDFRGDDGKLMKSLKCSVDILCPLSDIVGEGVSLPFPPAKVIFVGMAVLLAAAKDVSASYDALVDLFASFENFLSRLSIYTGIPPTPALRNVLVKIIVELLSTLALATKQVKQGRFKKFMKKLRGENDIEEVLQRLDRLTLDETRATAAQTLEVVYGLVQQQRVVMDEPEGNESAVSISSALESIQEIVGKMNEAERDKVRRDVRDWLSPPDPWKNHKIACESQHDGTGTWWIQGEAYAEWKSSGRSSLLWINGKPGAGKSIICSAIIQDIRALQKSGLASIAFFYCDFRDDQKKDRHGLLSSLLVQLCEQSDTYSAILSDFYVAHDRGSQHASDSELAECLEEMLTLPGQAAVYIVIDALDECPATTGMPSPREKVLDFVEGLVGLHVPNLRICVTSRPEADIVPVLDPLVFRSVSLHSQSGQIQDIVEYIKFKVRTDPKMRVWRVADKELVIDVLTSKADGMFRWVFCQLAYLRYCLRGRIQRALDDLPETLDETYARTLEDIGDQNWECARRLFQCVAAASRPLHVDELAEFLAFDFEDGSTPTFLADWRSEDPENAVLSTCSSLLAVVNVDGSPVIQFAHFSVKEYLTSTRLAKAKGTISRFHTSMTPAHTVVAQASLCVLLHLDKNVTRDSLEDFPLAKYAAQYWVGHAQFDNVASNVQDGMKRLFNPKKYHLSIWLWLYDPESPRHPFTRAQSERPSQSRATPLHYAAFCGMHDVAKFLIVEHSQDVNTQGFGEKETPLHVASRRGHVDVAQLLLEHGADVNARNNAEFSPLLLASREGYAEIARILLEHGADAEARDDDKRTPLFLAVEGGYVAVARILLEHSADTEAREANDMSPLEHASIIGNVEIVRLLLEHSGDARSEDENRDTPLHFASANGKHAVVQMLLEHGVDANAQNTNSRTPLHRAKGGETARLLLEHGADANALCNQSRTPLHHAAEYGRMEVAQTLLEHGVDPNTRDANNATPLHLASSSRFRGKGHHQVDFVRLLLQYNSDIRAQDDKGRTAFMRAKAKGDRDTMRLLLEHGANDHRK